MSVDIVNEKKVLEILESNKDEISHYYFQLRSIEVFEFDTSLDDFKNLIHIVRWFNYAISQKFQITNFITLRIRCGFIKKHSFA